MSQRRRTTTTRRQLSAAARSRPPRSTGVVAFIIAVLLLIGAALTQGPSILGGRATPTPVVAPGQWWQVYFTEPVNSDSPALFVNGIDRYLVQAINEATATIDLAVFEFNLPSITDALVRASRDRHVRIRVVADDEHGLHDEESTLGQLIDVGIPVVSDGRQGLMHNKFIIIDGQQVWTGAWNLTLNGTFRNNNNVIAIRSRELAAIYTREFEEMFTARRFGAASPTFSDPNEQFVNINGTPIQAYFSSEDGVADKLAALVDAAQSSIRFMAFSFTSDAIGNAVLRRARAGVDVAGLFEKRGSTTEYSELVPMFCAQLPVRQDGNPSAFHHKVFVLDGETVIVGSFNFSANADRDNDENLLVIRNRDIAARYLAEFNTRWAQGTAPEGIACSG